MTEEQKALREAVARELANDMGEVVERTWRFYLRGADAAIAVVLERAAEVAENSVRQECCGNHLNDGSSFPECCGSPDIVPMYPNEIAAAIRALIPAFGDATS